MEGLDPDAIEIELTMNGRATESVHREESFSKNGQRPESNREHALSFLTGRLNGLSGLANNTGLIVSQPNDASELEAERVADRVTARPLNSAFKETAPQISKTVDHAAEVSDHVSDVTGGAGSPLEPARRADMEQRL